MTRKRYKGRGKDGLDSSRPICPNCKEDLKVSLEYSKGKAPQRYGLHCKACKYQIFDEIK